MMDYNITTCRICLEDGAIYPIFESNEEFESVYAKLAVCIREKLEDIDGYPCNICSKCKNTSEVVSDFIATFEKSCEILQNTIIKVKTENQEDDYMALDDTEPESFVYELEIKKVESKTEKRDPAELLQSLSNVTVKRIKVEGKFETVNKNNAKKKKARPVKKKVGKPKGTGKKAAKKEVDRPGRLKVVKPLKEKKVIGQNQVINNISKLCDLCGMICKTADCLIRHKTTAHRERTYKCTKCPKTYFTNRNLKIHNLKFHENVRNAICDYCGKAFLGKWLLKSHIELVHLKNKEKTIHIYKCKYCDKTFKYKKGAIVHERAVHTGERPAKCDICGSSFYDETYLKEHMRLHTGDTPYKCPVCARGYAQRGNMKSHMRNHKISELDPHTLAKIKPSYFKFMRP